MPESAHFHSDIILHRPDTDEEYSYYYLLLKEGTDLRALERKMTQLAEARFTKQKPHILLMPLRDIHLHSHMLREMEVNGNINYLYLVVGADLLLLCVVLLNLWLNQSLLFVAGRKYCQLLRINGASSLSVLKDEFLLALLSVGMAVAVGIVLAYSVFVSGYFPGFPSPAPIVWLALAFLGVTLAVSLIPVWKNIASTLFTQTRIDLKPMRFSYANVKYMLTVQYVLVMLSVILAFGIGRQMHMVKSTQVGGDDPCLLVMDEQPWEVTGRYARLKSELLKHPEIEAVTAAYQLPGDAIRDYITVIPEGSDGKKEVPLLLTDKDFLSFYDIPILAGRGFSPDRYDYQTEERQLMDRMTTHRISGVSEEYLVNREALALLGFRSPEEAIGKTLRIENVPLDYINTGVICGVTDDFNYTGLHETTGPLILLKRQVFLHCFMVRLRPDRYARALAVFGDVWKQVNPDYPANYTFMNDVFGRQYANELNAERLVYLFSFLCFLIADLGLIIFMSFLIKRRTKEIAVRKVVGADIGDIVRMLNIDYIRRILVAFVIVVPVAWYVMHRWLENFAYQTTLDWWIFALAGLMVLLLSSVSVSLQSVRAAVANPVDALKRE